MFGRLIDMIDATPGGGRWRRRWRRWDGGGRVKEAKMGKKEMDESGAAGTRGAGRGMYSERGDEREGAESRGGEKERGARREEGREERARDGGGREKREKREAI